MKPLAALSRTECNFPVGRDGDGEHLFCAADKPADRSYCDDCDRLAHIPGTAMSEGMRRALEKLISPPQWRAAA